MSALTDADFAFYHQTSFFSRILFEIIYLTPFIPLSLKGEGEGYYGEGLRPSKTPCGILKGFASLELSLLWLILWGV